MKQNPYQDKRRIMDYVWGEDRQLVRISEVNKPTSRAKLLEHIHPDSFEFVFFQSGSQNYSVNSKLYRVKSGEMFIAFPNEKHGTAQYFEERSHFYYMIFYFTPEMQRFLDFSPYELHLAKNILFSLPGRVFPVPRHMFSLLPKPLDYHFSKNPFRNSLIQSSITEIFCELLTILAEEQKGQNFQCESETLEIMQNYILRNISRKVSVAELADYVHLSESRVYQIFNESGTSVHEYVLREKVDLAKEMLLKTRMTVTEIAFQLNFSSSQHFATVFRRYTGYSPSVFRRRSADVSFLD